MGKILRFLDFDEDDDEMGGEDSSDEGDDYWDDE